MTAPDNPAHPESVTAADENWMREALAWSRRGKGWTSPRPSVGCVIVQFDAHGAGRIIGGGHTQPGHGNPHAEIAALHLAAAAGETARGATAFVTLEPCCHHGTTPPCTDALIEAGIGRVVVGILDPYPAVNGGGFAQLRAAGIPVATGCLEDECRRIHEDFVKAVTTLSPFVTLKAGMSLDGKIATSSGESQWITGIAARRRGHELRHEHDCVLIGSGTALADDPLLNVRLEGNWKQPARVVVDTRGRLSLTSQLVRTAREQPLYLAVGEALPRARREAFIAADVRILPLPLSGDHINFAALLAALYDHGVQSILIEGGPQIAGAALASGWVDKVVCFIAPMLLPGGRDVLAGVASHGLADGWRLEDVQVEQLGVDLMVSGMVVKK